MGFLSAVAGLLQGEKHSFFTLSKQGKSLDVIFA